MRGRFRLLSQVEHVIWYMQVLEALPNNITYKIGESLSVSQLKYITWGVHGLCMTLLCSHGDAS